MIAKALLIWFLCMLGAIANGSLREFIISPVIGATWGHILSTVLLCLIILGITWATIVWMRPADARQAWMIGACWLLLTLAFEFGFGHYVSRKSWAELLADYHLLKGRIWVFVPVTTLLAPWWMARLRGLFH